MTLHDLFLLTIAYAVICGLSLWVASKVLP
jgi:hypothetical protein